MAEPRRRLRAGAPAVLQSSRVTLTPDDIGNILVPAEEPLERRD
jgi:hypothetical protein